MRRRKAGGDLEEEEEEIKEDKQTKGLTLGFLDDSGIGQSEALLS